MVINNYIHSFSQPTHYYTPHKLLLFLNFFHIKTASSHHIFKLNNRKDQFTIIFLTTVLYTNKNSFFDDYI